MNELEIGKFIEKKGLEIVVTVAAILLLFSGLVFYFYAWQALNEAANSTAAAPSIKQALLEVVVRDLDERQDKLNKLKESPEPARNIFK
ncbi:MAG: hypothetical protein AAB725_00450 [Patescibacteria group bacterium]